MCAMPARSTSGRLQQRWAEAVEATMRARLAIRDRLGSAARAVVEAESLALTDRIARLVAGVTPYRHLVERAIVRVRRSA